MEQIRAIVVGVRYKNIGYDFERSMEECCLLAKSCGIEVVRCITQNLDYLNPNTYIGSGKMTQIEQACDDENASLVIMNEECTPSQLEALENGIHREVVDRTYIILEIFASRAKTKEARLQVKIARLKYMLPRLRGMSPSLYSQQGGKGFRGSGETKLELDNRRIKKEISNCERELKEIVLQRQTQRNQRKKKEVKTVAIVGYTNSGKSTLMNRILQTYDKEPKKVFAADMLFATLETSTRSVVLEDKRTVLFTDTVGFVDQLPTHLIKAFRSTLEEVKEADLLVHVADASNEDYDKQIETTNTVLREIGVQSTDTVYVFNKMDLVDRIVHRKDAVYVSLKEDATIEPIIRAVKEKLFHDEVSCTLRIPYEETNVYSFLYSHHPVQNVEETDTGYVFDVCLSRADADKYGKYRIW
ncbi:MAG: GTPase HflX [Erysipelotrichaceae bacterium]|nr:GTPase HflX [Erysipelotrichaceae bacterium]